MPIYRVPFNVSFSGHVDVEADDPSEAMDRVQHADAWDVMEYEDNVDDSSIDDVQYPRKLKNNETPRQGWWRKK